MKCLEFRMLYSSYCRVSFDSQSQSPQVFPYLTSRVDDFGCEILSIVFNDSAECVLNRRVVAFYKMMFDKANGERRFTWCNVSVISRQIDKANKLNNNVLRVGSMSYQQIDCQQ